MWRRHLVGRTNDRSTLIGLEFIHEAFHPEEQRPFNFQFPLPVREVRREPSGNLMSRLLNGIRERFFPVSVMERPIGMSRLGRALRATSPVLDRPIKSSR